MTRLAEGEYPRVLMLTGDDVLDEVVAEWAHRPDIELRLVGTGTADEARAAAVAVGPTHLVVRENGRRAEDLDRCRAFVLGALAAADSTVRGVIQTHCLPQGPEARAYDEWLKRDALLRPRASLCIIWHDPLADTFTDCRGELQTVAAKDAWARLRRPVRLLGHQIFSGTTHDLEYVATRYS